MVCGPRRRGAEVVNRCGFRALLLSSWALNGTVVRAAAAVRLGAREAVARGRPLRILHVFSPGPGARSPSDDAPDWATARHEAGRIVVRRGGHRRRTVPGCPVEGLLPDGLPVRELLRQSRTAD